MGETLAVLRPLPHRRVRFADLASLLSLQGEPQNGEVTLESRPGVGSEFRVVLDFPQVSPQAPAQLDAASAVPGNQALLVGPGQPVQQA